MAAIEILLYAITALIVINGIAVFAATWIAIQSGRVEEYRRQYWKDMSERAKAETERNEPSK